MRFFYYAVCNIGKVRAENQDNIYCNGVYFQNPNMQKHFAYGGVAEHEALFAVADGMGGEANGAEASLIAVQALDCIERAGGTEALISYLMERNEELCRMILNGNGRRIGTTFAGILFHEMQAHIINIGDSRIYLYREGELHQLSRDHTVIQPMIEMGILSVNAARIHPSRHKLSQHLGIFPEEMIIEPHVASGEPQNGDRFLLCSDGLTDMLEDWEIKSILQQDASVEWQVNELMSSSLKRGGKDNISILMILVTESSEYQVLPINKSKKR